jgi:acylphosphatase
MADVVERFSITGRVQGVSYRRWAQANAKGLGLRGYVRNMADGPVEAVLAGDAERLDAFAEAALAGPPGAQVDEVKRSPANKTDLSPGDGVEIADDG